MTYCTNFFICNRCGDTMTEPTATVEIFSGMIGDAKDLCDSCYQVFSQMMTAECRTRNDARPGASSMTTAK